MDEELAGVLQGDCLAQHPERVTPPQTAHPQVVLSCRGPPCHPQRHCGTPTAPGPATGQLREDLTSPNMWIKVTDGDKSKAARCRHWCAVVLRVPQADQSIGRYLRCFPSPLNAFLLVAAGGWVFGDIGMSKGDETSLVPPLSPEESWGGGGW